jgi:hypothetical protein
MSHNRAEYTYEIDKKIEVKAHYQYKRLCFSGVLNKTLAHKNE